MRKIAFLVVILCSLLMNFGCGTEEVGNARPDETQEEILIPDIVFLYQCTNYSDTYVNYGCFIDKTGKVFTFDVSKEDHKYGDKAELVGYLKNATFEKEELQIDYDEMKSNYKKMQKIAKDAKIEEEIMGADVTDCVLYGMNGKDIIFLSETGNTERIVKDENAKEVVEWFNKQIQDISLYPASLVSK